MLLSPSTLRILTVTAGSRGQLICKDKTLTDLPTSPALTKVKILGVNSTNICILAEDRYLCTMSVKALLAKVPVFSPVGEEMKSMEFIAGVEISEDATGVVVYGVEKDKVRRVEIDMRGNKPNKTTNTNSPFTIREHSFGFRTITPTSITTYLTFTAYSPLPVPSHPFPPIPITDHYPHTLIPPGGLITPEGIEIRAGGKGERSQWVGQIPRIVVQVNCQGSDCYVGVGTDWKDGVAVDRIGMYAKDVLGMVRWSKEIGVPDAMVKGGYVVKDMKMVDKNSVLVEFTQCTVSSPSTVKYLLSLDSMQMKLIDSTVQIIPSSANNPSSGLYGYSVYTVRHIPNQYMDIVRIDWNGGKGIILPAKILGGKDGEIITIDNVKGEKGAMIIRARTIKGEVGIKCWPEQSKIVKINHPSGQSLKGGIFLCELLSSNRSLYPVDPWYCVLNNDMNNITVYDNTDTAKVSLSLSSPWPLSPFPTITGYLDLPTQSILSLCIHPSPISALTLYTLSHPFHSPPTVHTLSWDCPSLLPTVHALISPDYILLSSPSHTALLGRIDKTNSTITIISKIDAPGGEDRLYSRQTIPWLSCLHLLPSSLSPLSPPSSLYIHITPSTLSLLSLSPTPATLYVDRQIDIPLGDNSEGNGQGVDRVVAIDQCVYIVYKDGRVDRVNRCNGIGEWGVDGEGNGWGWIDCMGRVGRIDRGNDG